MLMFHMQMKQTDILTFSNCNNIQILPCQELNLGHQDGRHMSNAPFTLDEDVIAVECDNGKMTNSLVVAVSLLSFAISPQASSRCLLVLQMFFFKNNLRGQMTHRTALVVLS